MANQYPRGSNLCPHCGAQPCLPVWRKLCLGPMASARCRTCGLKVTVAPLQAGLALAPTLLFLVLARLGMLGDLTTTLLLMGASLVGTIIAYVVWVPLALDQISNATIVAEGKARVAAGKAGSVQTGVSSRAE